jgi:hypothetical protein
MTPPGRRAAQSHQPRGLRGNAVGRHELLLLSDRVEEAERVHAEADHADREQHEQAERGARQRREALPSQRRCEDEERQHEPCGQLDSHTHRERARSGTQARTGPGAQREREREQRHDERVVVRAADRQHEQNGIQPHEARRPTAAAPEAVHGAPGQGDRGEARERSERLERPQTARQPERRGGVAGEREQRAVWGVLKRPADEREDPVGGRFGGEVRVGVEAVQRAHARKREVTEHVLGDQRRSEQQDRVREHDRSRDRAHRKPSRGREDERVARAHDQREGLEAPTAQTHAEAVPRACEPRWPATAARRHILRRRRRGARAHQQHGREDAEQSHRSDRPHETGGHARVACWGRHGWRPLDGLYPGCGSGGEDESIVTSAGWRVSPAPGTL